MINAEDLDARPVVIYGAQGCGKSTIIRRIMGELGKTHHVEEWAGSTPFDVMLEPHMIAETSRLPPYSKAPEAIAISYEEAVALFS